MSYTWDATTALPLILQDSQGNTYVYGLDLISRTDSGGSQEYYLYDGLGSTTDLTNGSGTAIASYQYDVFGAIRSQTGSSANEFKFTGEQLDATGLQYLRARYYDPGIGRFLAQDPVRGGNLYAYVGSNPVNFVDPYGLFGCDLGPFGDPCDATEWWAEQHVDNFQAYTDYLSAVYQNPSSYPQETIGLWIAWGSFGNRGRENGVTFYEDCIGVCSWQRLFGYRAWTVGHNVFVQGNLDECLLKAHELTHVQQSERLGLSWLPRYFRESIEHGYLNNRFEAEALAAAEAACQLKE